MMKKQKSFIAQDVNVINRMIETKVISKTVGEVYNDSWSNKFRVSFDSWEDQREFTEEKLDRFLERRGLNLKVLGYSGSSFMIVNRQEKHICSECGYDMAFYDQKSESFYCPVCKE